jgi:hypothetical protein
MIFHPNSHLNKHGYFSVGNQNLYSKLDAIKLSMTTGDEVQWHYNDEVFSKQNWIVEPEKNIRTMYRERAQAIRDKFDYVVVMFSGGADSTTVLDSFIDNGIPVDEIFMNYWIKYQPEKEKSFMNAEITYSALPYLKQKLPTGWNTLVRLYDPSDFMLEHLKDKEFRQNSYHEVNNVHNLQMISVHYNLHRRFQKYIDLIESGKKIGFIWGEAKPRINYDLDKNKHYFYFEDHYAHAPQPRDQIANDPSCNHEQFFDDPGHAEIKVKQAHLILKTLKQVQHRSDIFIEGSDKSRDSPAVTFHNNQLYRLDRNAFNFAIYPDWNFLTYHLDKLNANRILHRAHVWMQEIEPAATRDWFMGYADTYGRLPHSWIRYHGSLKNGIKRLTIPYYLE